MNIMKKLLKRSKPQTINYLTKLINQPLRRFCKLSNINNENTKDTQLNHSLSTENRLAELGEHAINEAIKYKIFENSTVELINELKVDIPQISEHIQFQEYIKNIINNDLQEEALNKSGLVILKDKTNIMHKYNIDPHNYLKVYQDREYDIDIKHELNKDLFEKQRVVDSFVEENKQKLNSLIGYYNNKFKYFKHNKYVYLVYQNRYVSDNLGRIQRLLLKNMMINGILSVLLCCITPKLLVLQLIEYLILISNMSMLNNTVDQIYLNYAKDSVFIRKLNFLGFRKSEFNHKVDINSLFLLSDDKVKINKYLNLENNSWFNTFGFLKDLFISKETINSRSDTVKDKFIKFHKVKANVNVYFIPADITNQDPSTNEELLLLILNKEQDKIDKYDYTPFEFRFDLIYAEFINEKKAFYKAKYQTYVSKEDELKVEYSNIRPNRDYGDSPYTSVYKRSDDIAIDGGYIDNGYR